MAKTKKTTKTVNKRKKTVVDLEKTVQNPIQEEKDIKWKPVAKEKKSQNSNFFAKFIDFFHF